MIGICSSFDRFRGYGFVVPTDESGEPLDQPDVFIHANDLKGNRKYLKRGDVIAFEVGTHKERTVAVNAHVLENSPLSV
jgi:cold shock CspA family protein